MARSKDTFTVNRPKAEVYRFLSDPASVGSCLSFVRETEKNEGLHWQVKRPMSTITSTSSLALKFQADPEGEIEWHGESSHLESKGQLVLRGGSEQETEVELTLEMIGVGPMSVVIEPLASVQISNQIVYFAACLRGKLE